MGKDNWYLYRHLKPCGEVFYIGIGKIKNFKRAYDRCNRNNYWKNVVSKYGYETQILKKNMPKEEACELERILISWYGRKDCLVGTLVNMTDGGEGTQNLVQSDVSKKKRADKIKVLYKGEGNPFYGKSHSVGTKKYISEYQKEFYQYSETFPENVTTATHRKDSRKVIHLKTKKINNSLREASQYYGIKIPTLKGRMQKDRKFQGNLWYLDEVESISEEAVNIISFLEISKVRKENLK